MKPDVIVAEFSLHMSSTYDLILRKEIFGEPRLVFWSHGYNMDRGLEGFATKMLQLPRVFLAKFADAHVVYSSEGKDFLSRSFPTKRIFVAPNTIDIEFVRSKAREARRDQRKNNGPAFIAIGRFTPDKRFPLLISVFRKFLRFFPNAKLSIIGAGPDESTIREEAGGLLGSSVFLEGSIYDENILAEFFVNSDVVVFTGAVGLSVNHALAYGVPIVAFQKGPKGPFHHPEICYIKDGVTGKLVRGHREEDMVATLVDLFSKTDNVKDRFMKTIESFVNEKMGLENMIQGFEQLNNYLA